MGSLVLFLPSSSIFYVLRTIFLAFLLVDIHSFYHYHHHHHHHHRHPHKMSVRMGEIEKVSFGERLDLQLPTLTATSTASDVRPVLEAFLANPVLIIKQVWEEDKVKELGNDKYLLRFVTIPVLNITPEIEVIFVYNEMTRTVSMTSGAWRMLGQGGMKSDDDKEFLNSFDISLSGELSVKDATPIGWIRYAVSAKKPSIFKTAPFLLDGTIDFVKVCVKDFVLKIFPREFQRSYDQFSKKFVPGSSGVTTRALSGIEKSTDRRTQIEEENVDYQFEVYETLGFYTLSNREKEKIIDELSTIDNTSSESFPRIEVNER